MILRKLKNILAIIIIVFVIQRSDACTNILISKGASQDSSTMITYSADWHVLYGELYYFPAKEYKKNEMLDIYDYDTKKYLGKIKQVKKTYAVIGNMNEHQLVIAETTYGGRPELVDSTGIIDYGSLMYITLQRAKTAREAIYTMDKLLKKYGYNSSGESFSFADPNEVWVMDMIGKGIKTDTVKADNTLSKVNLNKGAVWVARKVPEGAIAMHANHPRITTFPLNDPDNCIYSDDVISFAREMGYFDGKDEEFSFADAYAPLDFECARFCEARVYAVFNRVKKGMEEYLDYAMGTNLEHRIPLFIYPDKKLSVKDVMELMRDYYQGTPMDMTKDIGAGPYSCIIRWRPLTWTIDSVEYFNERAISTQQTGFSFVSQSRNWLPNPIGGISWFGVDDTYSTVYTPMYCGMTKIPENFAHGNGNIMEFSETSAFWLFNQVSNFAYTRYNLMIPEIRKKQAELEDEYIKKTQETDVTAVNFYNQDPEKAVNFITDYSNLLSRNTFNEWKKLYHYLFTKYMDGNVKYMVEDQPLPVFEQPGYSEDWYRTIIEHTGDKFKVPETKE